MKNEYVIVHPLDDVPEKKVDVSRLGPMRMTPSVRWSLFALRAYLLLMLGLVGYSVATHGGMAHIAMR